MKNKRKPSFTLTTAAVCLLAAVPVQAGTISQNLPDSFWGEIETVSYIIDFLDYDGNLLDSRICVYGEKLENIIVPEREEDEQYIYQFAGWEPQLSETVTDCASYMAVYRKKGKSDTDGDGSGFELEMPEETAPSPKVLSNGSHSEEPQQISAISYDVISFHIENPAEEVLPSPIMENTASANKLPDTADTLPESAPVKERMPKTAEPAQPDNEKALLQPQPHLPAVSDPNDKIPESVAVPIHTKNAAAVPKAKPAVSDIVITKKNTPPSSTVQNISAKAVEKTTYHQKNSGTSIRKSGISAPVLKKRSRVQFLVSILTGILTGCMVCNFCFVKKRKKF